MIEDDPRLPKDMFGWRNYPGRALLRQIDDDHPTVWLRRRRFEVESRNKGGHLIVKPQPPTGLDGYFSSGQILSGGIHIMGDADAYGTFTDRGQFTLNSGFVFNASSISSSFDGWGQTLSAVRLGYVANNQGIGCPTFQYTAYTTYNGTKYIGMYSFYFTRATFKLNSESINGTTNLLPSRYGPANAQQKMGMGYAGIVMDTDKQIRPFILRDYYGGNVVMDFPPYVKDQYPWEFSMRRLAPTILMTKLDYRRSEYPIKNAGVDIPNRIDNSKCPGYEIRFSHDNGTNWSIASSTEFFHEFDDTILTLPTEGVPPNDPLGSHATKANAAFNMAANYLVLQVAPISGTKALAYGLVPYLVEYIPASDSYKIGGKVKLGIVDAAAGTLMATQTLYENEDVDKAWYWMGSQAFESVKGGVLLSHTPIGANTVAGNPWRDPPQPGFTPDGVTIAWQPIMDVPSFCQGFFLALGPNEVGSVSFINGEYVLRSTKDHGMTWARRALVTANGVAPNDSFQQPSLTQFSAVSQIRTGNVGSNPMQGVPWVCDSRIKAPIL